MVLFALIAASSSYGTSLPNGITFKVVLTSEVNSERKGEMVDLRTIEDVRNQSDIVIPKGSLIKCEISKELARGRIALIPRILIIGKDGEKPQGTKNSPFQNHSKTINGVVLNRDTTANGSWDGSFGVSGLIKDGHILIPTGKAAYITLTEAL